ncbi:hypothetical protein GCM10027073_05660 [Streptomyces chlorus]
MSAVLLSTVDTDLPAARASTGVSYRIGSPTRVNLAAELPALLDGVELAVVRLPGGKRAWEAEPDQKTLDRFQATYLEHEGDPEEDQCCPSEPPHRRGQPGPAPTPSAQLRTTPASAGSRL